MSKKIEQSLSKSLKKYFGFNSFKGNQEPVIKNVMSGNDTFVLMPTGGGKSLCYQLPSLLLEGTAIVISPLIALMKNQVDAMRNFSNNDGIAHFLNSSLNKSEIQQVKLDITNGITKLLYVAPESLTKEENIAFLQGVKISFYAIDEAHCISEWGHDFRPEYRKIRPIIDQVGNAAVVALTATATLKVQHDIQKNLGMLDSKVYKSSFNRPNLYYEVRPKTNAAKEIIKYIKSHSGSSGIIYCLSRKKVEELAETLQVNGVNALGYHAGMDSATRSRNQDMFLMEDADVIVATIAFGMGIDKPDVRYVIHYDIPKSLEGYYQETGRAGRDGGVGECLTFYSYKDIQKLEKFMQGKPVAEQEIGKQLLLETVAYAESSVCRRKLLLHYFGETYTEDNCGACDNCNNPKPQFEGKEDVVTILNTTNIVKGRYKSEHVADIISGNSTSAIKSYKHDELKCFGFGKKDEKDNSHWNAVIRQALIAKFLSKDIENYGLISVTEEGNKFINNPKSFMLTKNQDYDSSEFSTGASGGTSTMDPVLMSLLKDLRKKIATKKKIPPFVIFQDPSLEDMAIQYPINITELTNITGVGTGKASRYGEEFIKLIKKHVEENDIERPQDLIVKSIVNKSVNKVYIIQSIDRKLSLKDIASAKGLSILELIDELEAIVYSGTKLDIVYYVENLIDEESYDDLYDYYNEAETDKISAALDELEEYYTEEEVRLMRIVYISEMGN